jgi:hypothetical protein
VVAHLGLLRLLDARCVREHVGAGGLTTAGIEGLLIGVVVLDGLYPRTALSDG